MFSANSKVKGCIDVLHKAGIGRGMVRLGTLIDNIYNMVEVKDRTILDIGCGEGILSFSGACGGARKVVALEPELDGSTAGFNSAFEKVRDTLGLNNVFLYRETLQNYDYKDGPFDIVIMYNVINHLDEASCIVLTTDAKARESYRDIFQEIFNNMSPGGVLIITDCSNKNFFADIGITNPVAKTIEWNKHQPPGIWQRQLQKVGFSPSYLTWNPLHSLGPLRPLFRNWLGGYLTNSHFILRMTKPDRRAVVARQRQSEMDL